MSNQQISNTDRTLGYRRLVTTFILAVALVGFEIFNFSTTAYALDDLLGQLSFLGLRWATVLAIAFCSIDFAGIARLFLPESEQAVPKELWYLFGAWLLAATMNAILTWWGISMAVVNRTLISSSIINPQVLTHGIPVFIAILVWVTRILLIGSFSMSVRSAPALEYRQTPAYERPVQQPLIVTRKERSTLRPAPTVQPIPKPRPEPALPLSRAPQPIDQAPADEPEEPVYLPMDAAFHSLSASSNKQSQQHNRRF